MKLFSLIILLGATANASLSSLSGDYRIMNGDCADQKITLNYTELNRSMTCQAGDSGPSLTSTLSDSVQSIMCIDQQRYESNAQNGKRHIVEVRSSVTEARTAVTVKSGLKIWFLPKNWSYQLTYSLAQNGELSIKEISNNKITKQCVYKKM